LLAAHPVTTDALASLLDCAGQWSAEEDLPIPGAGDAAAAAALVSAHPGAAQALAVLIGG
jgi:hypothetical protein